MRIQPRKRFLSAFACGWLTLGITLVPASHLAGEPEATAEQRMKLGQTAYDRGAFDEALTQWRQAEQLYAAQSNNPGRVKALLDLGAVHQALGQDRLAFQALERAGELAENSPGRPSLLAARS